MARIRTVKPSFFRHRRLFLAEQESGMPLRLAFEGLWTCADREGRFRWEPDELKLDCLPYDEVDFSRVMDALFTRGFVVKYIVGGRAYGVIPSFKDHQVINNREAASDLPEPPENLDELVELANISDASSTRDPRDTDLHKRNMEGKGREGKGTENGTRRDRASDAAWEKIKKLYPKRRGSNPWEPARKLYLAALASGDATSEEIISALEAKVGFDPEKIGTEYIPQAVKWFRDKRWKDRPVAVESNLPVGFYARFASQEMDAWDAYERKTGRRTPRDKNGGWHFPTQWPPGWEAQPSDDAIPDARKHEAA